ncbi:MAG: hypothetical protein K8F91_08435, partial [Candidatus Obscuribacterales bacterium]|nr:hypothetical protein [Candidatus Obscuribacterales bacterium]
LVDKASKVGSDQAQKDMPEHVAKKQKENSDFKQAGLEDKPRTFVSEALGRQVDCCVYVHFRRLKRACRRYRASARFERPSEGYFDSR